MLRPGGFPEYTPSEQRIFDTIVSILTKNFEKRNYQHIMTPAVEPVDILTRGGDIGDKQVYGLYGLAQGNQDTKDYALHFDLTVPFARYVLDHMNDLVFPFKRYQMQPVRRGERTKRGRYKEFRQFDIDTIRRSETDVGSRYDAESIIVCYQSLQEIFAAFNINKKIIVKFSDIGLTKHILNGMVGEYIGNDGARKIKSEEINDVLKLLDNYYKLTKDNFQNQLNNIVGSNIGSKIKQILDSKDINLVKNYGYLYYSKFSNIYDTLKKYKVNVEYDLAIIRGHNYYTGTVVEFFLKDDIEIGAIAGGGSYNGLTNFINPRHSFSGVGCSISSRIMEVILGLDGKLGIEESYMFLNLESKNDKTIDQLDETELEKLNNILKLMNKFHVAGKKCEIYPMPTKFKKQYDYAEKKGIGYCVVSGGEGLMMTTIKDTYTKDQFPLTFDQSYGIIPICEIDGVKKVALVKHKAGYRGFPKGHAEEGESIMDTARRECQEETGLTNLNINENQYLEEHYFISDRKKAIPIVDNNRGILKSVGYYIGNVQESNTLIIQKDELLDAQWYSLEEAMQLAMYPQMKEILKQASKYF